MLERPPIHDSQIIRCLRDDYGLNITRIDFLPLGADINTAVFRADHYFVKLRSGVFDEMTILVPKLLHDQGIRSIIAPVSTRSGELWASLDVFKLMVFPFVEGADGSQIDMSENHWMAFGQALKALHTTEIPSEVINRLQREDYSGQWREKVSGFLALVETTTFPDPIAATLAAFLVDKKGTITDLIQRAERLAADLQTQSIPFTLCHGDIHCWNLLIDHNDHLYMVDWDTLIYAPKERDLMFIGGGLFLNKRPPEEEERLFYQGYGQTPVNRSALAYYRYERIVQDIAAYCEQLLLSHEGGEDRANSLRQVMGQFEPGEVVDLAYRN